MNNNKIRNSCEKESYDYLHQPKRQKLETYFHNMFLSLKNSKNLNRKQKIKSILTSNIINYKNSKLQHKTTTIKKNMESSINLNISKNNFCGTFLSPDYIYISGARILKELKSKGPEKTVIKHFTQNYPKHDFIRNCKSYSATRNKCSKSKSKYYGLMNSDISLINKMTTFKKNQKSKYSNKLKYYDKYNNSFMNFFKGDNLKLKNKKIYYFNFNINNDKFFSKPCNNTNNISVKSFYGSSLNNSRTHLSSSTSCSSRTLKYISKN